MSYSVSYDSSRHLIELVFAGSVSNTDLELAKSEGAALSRKHDCHEFLIDSSDQKQLESIAILYEHADTGYAEEGLDRSDRAAIIMPRLPEMRQASRFYETVCRNRGWSVRSFEDRKAALEWLKPESSNVSTEGDG